MALCAAVRGAGGASGASGATRDSLLGEGATERLGVVEQVWTLREDDHRVLHLLNLVEEARILVSEAQDYLAQFPLLRIVSTAPVPTPDCTKRRTLQQAVRPLVRLQGTSCRIRRGYFLALSLLGTLPKGMFALGANGMTYSVV